jgi:hypothetical protein
MATVSIATLPKLSEKLAQIPAISENARALVVESDETAASAAALRKSITSLENEIEDTRVATVKPFNDTVKAVNAEAKRISEPLEAAKAAIKAKEIAYSAKLEEARQEHQRQRAECARAIQSAKTELEIDAALGSITYEDPELSVLAVSRKNQLAEQAAAAKIAQAAREGDANAAQVAAEKAAAMSERNAAAEKEALELAVAEKARLAASAPVAPKGVRDVVEFVVVDADKVPREFCEPANHLIREASNGRADQIRAGLFHIPGVKLTVRKEIR